jgi:putative ABC transport system permease protein
MRRTVTILLTVAMGTMGIFLFHGFNTGVMNQYRENVIRSRYGHGQLNTDGYRAKVFEKPWEQWITNFAEMSPELRAMPGVKYLFPRVSFPALLQANNINVSGFGQGIDGVSEDRFFSALNFVDGKTLSSEPDGIVMGIGLARAMNVKIGDRVTVLSNTVYGSINGVDLMLTGVFHTGVKDFDDVVFRLPLRQAQTLLDTDRVETVAVGLTDTAMWPQFQKAAEKRFPGIEATPFEELDKAYYQNSVNWLESQFNIIKIVIMSIVVLGILNSISTSVLERKQEIGNLRANGESSFDVLKLIVAEGCFLGFLGSSLGILIGWLLVNTLLAKGIYMPAAPGITRRFWVLIELQASYGLVAILLGALCTFVGSLLAGYRVARMNIAEALRSL